MEFGCAVLFCVVLRNAVLVRVTLSCAVLSVVGYERGYGCGYRGNRWCRRGLGRLGRGGKVCGSRLLLTQLGTSSSSCNAGRWADIGIAMPHRNGRTAEYCVCPGTNRCRCARAELMGSCRDAAKPDNASVQRRVDCLGLALAVPPRIGTIRLPVV